MRRVARNTRRRVPRRISTILPEARPTRRTRRRAPACRFTLPRRRSLRRSSRSSAHGSPSFSRGRPWQGSSRHQRPAAPSSRRNRTYLANTPPPRGSPRRASIRSATRRTIHDGALPAQLRAPSRLPERVDDGAALATPLYESCKRLQTAIHVRYPRPGRVSPPSSCTALFVAGLASPLRAGETTQLFPGVTYEKDVKFTAHGPVAIRVVAARDRSACTGSDGALERDGARAGDGVLDAAAPRGQATMVGVNGDFSRGPTASRAASSFATACSSRPRTASARASASSASTGLLDVRRVRFFGTWRGLGQRRALNDLQRRPGRTGSRSSPRSGAARRRGSPGRTPSSSPRSRPPFRTPISSRPSPQRRRTPSCDRAGGRRARRARERGGEAPVEAALGTTRDDAAHPAAGLATSSDAIGGGPVSFGTAKPVYRANEAFTVSQIAPRHPRTAIGQLADGRIVLVVVDGRQPGYSVGMTTFEMAQTMMRLGAVTRDAARRRGIVDAGFDGTVLNRRPTGASGRSPTALMLQYYGVFAPPPLEDRRLAERRRRRGDAGALVQGRPPVDRDSDAHRAGRHDRLAGERRASPGLRGRLPAAPPPPPPPPGGHRRRADRRSRPRRSAGR